MKSNKVIMISFIISTITVLSFSGCRNMDKKGSSLASSDFSSSIAEHNISNEYLTSDTVETSSLTESSNTDSIDNSQWNINKSDKKDKDAKNPKLQTGSSSNPNKPSNSNSIPSTTSSTTSPATPQNPTDNQSYADNQKLTTLTASEIKEMESYFLGLVNDERQKVGVQLLERNDTLDKAAKIRVEETFIKMGHTRPNGTDCVTILDEFKYGTPVENIWSEDGENWHTEIIYDYGVAGENLAGDYNSDRRDIKMITESFFTNLKNSSGHYRNMVSKSFNKTGVAVSSEIKDGVLHCHLLQIFTER